MALVGLDVLLVDRGLPSREYVLDPIDPPVAVAPPLQQTIAGAEGAATASPVPTIARPDLSGWAAALGPAVDIPPVALAAYGAAELTLRAAGSGCGLSWSTLAGIGAIESDHGRYAGAALQPDGRSVPPVIGVALDGSPGVGVIRDTDGGRLDGDAVHDRAVGPMQFIPRTWTDWGADGDGDGLADPFDLDDAALAAANYLCAAGGDLTSGPGWTAAVLAYNRSDAYVLAVHTAAEEYGRLSRAAAQPAG